MPVRHSPRLKLRKVALKAGAPREYGKAGPGLDYWIKEIRHKEMDYVERAERAYERMVGSVELKSQRNLHLIEVWRFSTPSVLISRRPSPTYRTSACHRDSA